MPAPAAESPRPPLKDAVVEVMGDAVMTAAQVLKAVEAKYGDETVALERCLALEVPVEGVLVFLG